MTHLAKSSDNRREMTSKLTLAERRIIAQLTLLALIPLAGIALALAMRAWEANH